MKKKGKNTLDFVEVEENKLIGQSIAIGKYSDEEFKLEDIVNDNYFLAYVNEHHTEIHNHGESSL